MTPFALERTAPGEYRAATEPDYWNQIGPFGGWLAGLAMAALRREAPPGWPVRAIALQFLGRIPAGAITVSVEEVRGSGGWQRCGPRCGCRVIQGRP